MATQKGPIQPVPAPDLNIPKSSTAVQISIINTTTEIVCPAAGFISPVLEGQEWLNFPTWSFHITHPTEGQIIFDLGARKDYWNLSPAAFGYMQQVIPALNVDAGIDEILTAGGVDLKEIKSAVWSHWHWDHTGDMSKFPSSTEVVVGPGFKESFMPGYPVNANALTVQADFEGREVREIAFANGFMIGGFQAHDFFGDGSFYLLNVPGHAVGHMSGLARTTEDTFVFMGGDICHFGGAFRPTEYVPMPENLPEGTPLDNTRFRMPCPCSLFADAHPEPADARTKPFFTVPVAEGGWYADPPVAQVSVSKLEEFDASPNVLVCIAHDNGLPKVVDFFPNGTLNDWKAKGWKDDSHWAFLNAIPTEGKKVEEWMAPGLMKDGKLVEEWTKFKP